MELTPITNTSPDSLVKADQEFNKQQLNFVDNDIKAKTTIDLSQNVKDYLHTSSTINPLSSLKDDKIRFKEFNIDVSEAYKPLSSGRMLPMYKDYVKGINNEERFVEEQSTANKWGNGLLKFVGKTLTAVVGGTVGTVNGVVEGIQKGSFQATYDNDFSNWLDDLNTKMDYNLPNYYSEQEKQKSIGESLLTANFWANDLLGGLSFTTGAVISEVIWAYATGGSSLATSGARLGVRAGKWFGEGAALTRAINKATQVVKSPVIKTFAKPNLPVELATTLGKVGELANTARFTYTSAGFEAGVEARQFVRESRDNYLDSFEKLNGRLPNQKEIAEFENDLNTAGNSLYAFNMAIVGSSNLAILGKFLNVRSPIKAPEKWANETLFGVGMKKTVEGNLEEIAASRLQKAFAKAYSVGKAPVVEGLWEEGQQSTGKNTASNWLKSAYDPKYLGNTIDLGTAFSNGLAEVYGTKEGWKEITIGMLTGLLSNTGMNIIRREGVFSEYNKANEKNVQEITLRNQYSTEKLLDRIKTANRIQSFTEAQEESEQIGDITGAEISRKAAIIAHVNNAYNYDYIDQAKEEVATAINAMDNQTLIREYKLKGDDEVKTLKDNLIKDYIETSDSYNKHRDFTEYYFNNESLGQRATEIKEAVAYELTLGEHSFNYSRELLGEIQKEIAKNYTTSEQSLSNALEIQDILWSSSKDIRRNFIYKQKELKQTKNSLNSLEKDRLSLEKESNTQQDNTDTLNKLNEVVVEIQQKQLEVQNLNTELEGVLSSAQLQNPYNNDSQPFITSTDLTNVDKDLKYVEELIKSYKNSSPQRGYRLEKLLKEYNKSKIAFTRYADLARQIQDPEMGLKGNRNALTRIIQDANTNEITLEFLQGLDENINRVVTQQAEEAVQNNVEVTDILNRAQITVPLDTQEKAVQTVEDIIKNNPYLLEYTGLETNITKPTTEEITEYKNLAKIILEDEKIGDKVTRVKPNYFSKKGVKTKLTSKQLTRLQELNQKMSDWRLFEGALNDEGISIADLINQEISKNQDTNTVQIQEDLTIEDYVLVSTPSESLPIRNGVEFRDASIIQTYENIKVKVNGIFYEFSHMNLSTILNKITRPYSVLMQTPSKTDENGYAIEWNKPREVNLEEAVSNQKNGGTKYTLQLEEGNVPVIITNQARIQIPINSFKTIKNSLGLDIFKQITTKNSYSDLYEANENGEYIQMESDFIIEGGDVSYTADELYDLEKNSNTFFKINIFDSYNEKLKEQYEKGEITLNDLISLVKVYNVSGNNKIIGDLKSNQDTSDSDPTFLAIRKRAAEILLNEQVAQGLVTIPYTAKVQYVLLGVPNITMEKTEDGVIPQARPITEEALEAIVDFGYVQNGNINLRNETKSVRKDFIDKLSKKTSFPIIVFKQGKFLVAYPVNLVKRPSDRGSEIANILTKRSLNNTQKATQINNYLAQNNINPKDFGLYYISENNQNMFNENQISDELNTALVALNEIQDVVDVQEWVRGDYSKEQLINDAQITIDLTNRPLRSPKVVLDFSQSMSTESSLTWYEQWLNTGEISEEKIVEIANKIVAENTNMDGSNALTNEENAVFVNETDRIEKAIENIYKMSEEKQKEANKEKRRKC